MARDLGRNPLLGDESGLDIYELEDELRGIFVRIMESKVAHQLIYDFNKMRQAVYKRPVIVMIDDQGKRIGSVEDCSKERERLRGEGFEFVGGIDTCTVATKQWAKMKGEMGA